MPWEGTHQGITHRLLQSEALSDTDDDRQDRHQREDRAVGERTRKRTDTLLDIGLYRHVEHTQRRYPETGRSCERSARQAPHIERHKAPSSEGLRLYMPQYIRHGVRVMRIG